MNVEHPNYGQSYQLTRAALRLKTFTVSELETLTGAVKNTIYSFVSRVRKVDPGFIEDIDVPTLRGRPQKRFTLSEAGRKHLMEQNFEAAARFGEPEEPSYLLAEQLEATEAVELPSDVYQQERELVFQVDVPGMAEEDVHVKIDDQGLVVSGVRSATMSRRAKPQLMERRHGHFQRSYPLPQGFHARIINVDVQKGVLEVVLRNEIEEPLKLASARGVSLDKARFVTSFREADSDDISAATEQHHYAHPPKATCE